MMSTLTRHKLWGKFYKDFYTLEQIYKHICFDPLQRGQRLLSLTRFESSLWVIESGYNKSGKFTWVLDNLISSKSKTTWSIPSSLQEISGVLKILFLQRSNKIWSYKIISQIVRISECCDQNSDGVSKNGESCHICIMWLKS